MTSANVSQIPVSGIAMNTPAKSAAKSNGDATDFMQIVSNSLSDPNMANVDTAGVSAPVKTEIKKSESAGTDKSFTMDSSADKIPLKNETSKNVTDEEMQKASESLGGFFQTVKDVISSEMNVTEEDIEQAVSELGFDLSDLTDTDNLTRLLSLLTGDDQGVSLLVDDTMEKIFQTIEPLIEDLFHELDVTDTVDLKNLLPTDVFAVLPDAITDEADTENTAPIDLGPYGEVDGENLPLNEEIATDISISISSESTQESNKPEASQDIVTVETVTTAEASTKEKTIEPAEKKDPAIGSAEKKDPAIEPAEKKDPAIGSAEKEIVLESDSPKPIQENQTSSTQDGLFKNRSDQNGSDETAANAGLSDSFATVRSDTGISFTETVSEEISSYTEIDPRDIMEQIVTQSRLQSTETLTTMELELHPASLGKMYLQVHENDGTINAKLFTENENVKVAMETQLAELKENWLQQGLKVNAVEISVGTREFEEQLEQEAESPAFFENTSSGNFDEEDRKERGTGARSIDLNHPEGLPEDLTEEEILTASMMRDLGNSVNYKV